MKLSDDELLQSIAELYAEIDPAPDDLADGVLARLAVEGLETEWELLTLVERVDLAAGTRAADTVTDGDDSTVALEFAGTSYRVLVRISTVDRHRRLDGWVVPAVPLRIFVGASDTDSNDSRQSVHADQDGRFEFPEPPTGQVRLWLVPQADGASTGAPSFVTPPFLI
jgi:hypothetical protein